MRQTRKQFYTRLVALAAALLILLGAAPAARAASGACGDGVTWTLTGGALTISGSGEMEDYSDHYKAPWRAYADQILSVRVESGVTAVGDRAFFQLKKITAASLADTVTEIGSCAFYDCEKLQLLDLGSGVRSIGDSAFEFCRELSSLRLPDGLMQIGNRAFYSCRSLLSVTVPRSVTHMGTEAFMYCSNLGNATVLADLGELPNWTFYGCYALKSVALSPDIDSVGVSAFEKCELLPDSYHVTNEPVDVDVTNTTVTQNGGETTVTKDHYTETSGGAINVQTTTQGTPGGETDTSIQVDAYLEDQSGWQHLEDCLEEAESLSGSETVDVNVHLKGDAQVDGDDLNRFSGKNVTVTIHTNQGANWHINGQDIQSEDLQDSYDLSFTQQILEPNEEQAEILGNNVGYELVFSGNIDFKTELELPLGQHLARETAVFLSPSGDGYDRMQAVVIDDQGIAHFYLGQVQAGVQYLIGINVPDTDKQSDLSDAIIPDSLKSDYGVDEQEQIEYVVTGVKSSWGMDIGQVTWILAGVMGGSILVVGIAVGLMNKRKLKKGYVPDLDNA